MAALVAQAFSPSMIQPPASRREVAAGAGFCQRGAADELAREQAGKGALDLRARAVEGDLGGDVVGVDEGEGEAHAGAREFLGDEQLGEEAGALAAAFARHLDSGQADGCGGAEGLARERARSLPAGGAGGDVVAAERARGVEQPALRLGEAVGQVVHGPGCGQPGRLDKGAASS